MKQQFRLAVIFAVLIVLGSWLFLKGQKPSVVTTVNRTKILVPGSLSNINLVEQTHPLLWDLRPLVFRNLLKWNSERSEVEADLALSWSQTDRLIEFTIDPKAAWQDGRIITSEDIAFSLGLHTKPESKSIYQNMYQAFIDKVVVVDPQTIRITTTSPSYYHLLSLGLHLQILPRHFYEGANGEIINPTRWLGSGDYKLKQFVPDRMIIFEHKNGQTLEVEFVANLDRRQNEIDKTRAEWAKLSWREALRLKAEGNNFLYSKSKKSQSGVIWLLLNHKNTHLAKTNVRKALMYGFDRERTNQLLHANEIKLGSGFWPESHGFASDQRTLYRFDINKSLQLLKEVGYADRDDDGVLESEKNEPLNFQVLVFSEEDERLVDLFSQAMRRMGISVKIKRAGEQEVYRRMNDGLYDAAVVVMPEFYKDLNLKLQFHSKRKQKWPVFQFSKNTQELLDKWLDEIEHTQNTEQRRDLHQKVDLKLNEELPHLFWYELPNEYWLKADHVQGDPPF